MKISVVITSYNQKEYLKEAIESVLAQTLLPFEIIVCDDGSTDGSQDLIRGYERSHPGLIKGVLHERNIGIPRNRNSGLERVQGDLVAWLDGDDRYLPQKLESEFNLYKANPDVKWVYSQVVMINAKGKKLGNRYSAPPQGQILDRAVEMIGRAPRNMLVEYESLKKIGFFKEDMNMYEDFELCMRLCKNYKCAYTPIAGLEYRIHTTGAHTQATQRHISNLNRLRQYFSGTVANMPEDRRAMLEKKLSNSIVELFPAARGERRTVAPIDSGGELIFLVSQPRAGSTMTQLLLMGHPEIATTSEPWIALHPLFALRKKGIGAEYNARWARMALKEFLRLGGMDEDIYMEEVGRFLLSLYRRQLQHQGKRLFLDKTPRYYHIIDDLIYLYPEAKFIVLYRNPLAVFNSILKSWVKGDWKFLSEYAADLLVAPGRMLTAARNNPGRCHTVMYEDIVKDTRAVLTGVCSYLGILFDEAMLDYSGRINSDWKFGDNIGIHKSVQPRTDSRERWMNGFVSPQERFLAITYIEALGPDTVKGMGYDYNELISSIEPLRPGESDGLITWETIIATAGANMSRAKSEVNQDADRQLRAMRASLSWRITAPLRTAASVLMRGTSVKLKK